jgi:predicted anti-sigma-YlaC factor YlaD
MNCREVTEFLGDYLGDGLALDVRQRFEQHLCVCTACQVFLTQYKDTILAGSLACHCDDDKVVIPEDLIRAIIHAVRPS